MDNKTKLLDNACHLFASKGYDAVGVQEVVTSSAVTKPTLYHYYGSKDGLLQAILERGFLRLEQSLHSMGAYHNDLPGYLERMALAWLASVEAQPDFFRVELSLVFLPKDHPGHKLVLAGQEALFDRMQDVFKAASTEHGNMRGRERVLAVNWLGMLHNWTSLYLGGWIDPRQNLLPQSLRQFLYGVFT